MHDDSDKMSVSGVVWPWRSEPVASKQVPSTARRKRALIEAIVGFSVGSIIIRFTQKDEMGVFVMCVATSVLLCGFLYPPGYRAFREFFEWLARWVGVFVTWLLLAPFFFVCFTFGRLVLAILGKDPMCRKCPSEEKTYWQPRKAVGDVERYTKQY